MRKDEFPIELSKTEPKTEMTPYTPSAMACTAAKLYAHVNELLRLYAAGERHLRRDIDEMQAAADGFAWLASEERRERERRPVRVLVE